MHKFELEVIHPMNFSRDLVYKKIDFEYRYKNEQHYFVIHWNKDIEVLHDFLRKTYDEYLTLEDLRDSIVL